MRPSHIWIILFWFVLLQTLSPLLHAHLETDTHQQPHGIHIHHIADTQAQSPQLHHLSDTDSEAHIITVDQGALKKNIQLNAPLLTLVIALLVLAQLLVKRAYTTLNLSPPQDFFSHNASPRAPPHA